MKPRHLFLVFTLTFAARLLLYSIPDRAIDDITSSVDCRDYVWLGRNLAEHGVFSRSVDPPFVGAADRTPLYPLMIAGIFKVATNQAFALRFLILIQMILGAATACLCALAAYPIVRRLRWALWAGILVGLEPFNIRYGFAAWTESLFVFLLMASTVLLFKHFSSRRPVNGFLFGAALCFALTALCRPVGQEMAFLAAVPALLLDSRWDWKTRFLKTVVPFVVVYLLAIAPWVARNWIQLDVHNLSTAAADAELIAASRIQAVAEALPKQAAPHQMADVEKRLLADFLSAFSQNHPVADGPLSEPEALAIVESRFGWAWPDIVPERMTGPWMRYVSDQSTGVLKNHLGLFIKSSARMCVAMVFGFNKDTLCVILNQPTSEQHVSSAVKSLVTGHLRSAGRQLSNVKPTEWLGLFWSGCYGIVVPLFAVIGLVQMIRRGSRPVAAFFLISLAILIVLTAFGIAVSYQTSRYVVPAKPFLVLLAAIGMAALSRWRAVCLPRNQESADKDISSSNS